MYITVPIPYYKSYKQCTLHYPYLIISLINNVHYITHTLFYNISSLINNLHDSTHTLLYNKVLEINTNSSIMIDLQYRYETGQVNLTKKKHNYTAVPARN